MERHWRLFDPSITPWSPTTSYAAPAQWIGWAKSTRWVREYILRRCRYWKMVVSYFDKRFHSLSRVNLYADIRSTCTEDRSMIKSRALLIIYNGCLGFFHFSKSFVGVSAYPFCLSFPCKLGIRLDISSWRFIFHRSSGVFSLPAGWRNIFAIPKRGSVQTIYDCNCFMSQKWRLVSECIPEYSSLFLLYHSYLSLFDVKSLMGGK